MSKTNIHRKMYNKWIFIKEKLNEVEFHQYESKLMVVHIYEDTPEPLFFLLQIKQSTTYIVFVHKQSISKLNIK